jgi:cytochrome c oxidase subunit IV
MSEFHDEFPQYELMAHHSEEEGKVKRRKLWNVFWIMLSITIVELIIGFNAKEWHLLDPIDRTSTSTLKILFIGMTLGKAYFIVYSFMHLGHEVKGVKYAIIAPYTIFILYLTYILVAEANYVKVIKDKMDPIIVDQKIKLNEAATSGHAHDGGEEHHESGEEAHH